MVVNVGETYHINKLEDTIEISFAPPKTGSYELICNGNFKLEGIFYGEESEECLYSTFMNQKYTLKFAKTLLHHYSYEFKLKKIEQIDVHLYMAMKIDYIPEPSNTLFKYQWGLLDKKNGLDINILPLWKYIKKSNMNIGIADTGINNSHCNLKEYINSKLAYNFVSAAKDCEGTYGKGYEHGTYVAGIVAAQPYHNYGVVGITENPNIVSLKIFGQNNVGENKATDAFVAAVEYSIKHNIRIINCSFCGADFSEKEKRIIEKSNDVLFVIAAGNQSYNLDVQKMYPACYELENSIVVAAIDREGKLYGTSNYGHCVDIAAPGENIVGLYENNGFIKANGTSSAAPFITGVCSLLFESKKDLKPREVKEIVTNKKNITPVKGIENCVRSGGILNAYKAYVSLMNREIWDGYIE